MREISTKVYTYDELSDKAKEKAREWYQGAAAEDCWYDNVIEDAVTIASFLGITVDQWRNTHWIRFSGFSSKGDGASFLGRWRASDIQPLATLKQYAPLDMALEALHNKLQELATQYPNACCTSRPSSSHYSHERSTDLEAIMQEEATQDTTLDAIALEECQVTFMKWIYARLEQEYDYINSDEYIAENMRSNHYEFTEDGQRA